MATKANVKQQEPVGAIEPTRLYRYEDIAPFLGVSARQVKRWCEEGWLGYVELPRGRRVSGQNYLDFIAAHNRAAEG